jgi:hypothetical protein
VKIELTLAALVAAAPAGPSNPPPQPAATAAIAVNYSRDIGWAGTLAIEVQRAGESSVLQTFNEGDTPEIGLWRSPVTAAKFDQLLAQLNRSGYEQLRAPAAVPPGTKLVSIGVRLPGQDLPTIRAFPSLPEPLTPVVIFLERLRSEIRAHPIRVLRGSASWKSRSVARSQDAGLGVTLTNVGTSAFNLANPLASTGSAWNGLRLVFTKKQGGGEQQQNLTTADLRFPPDADRAPMVSLAPGQSLRFEVCKKVEIPAGQHAVRFEYHSMSNRDDDAQFVGGVLWIDPGEITVKSGAWWKIW